jgi:capsular exopolysaccharide synthesis family protein
LQQNGEADGFDLSQSQRSVLTVLQILRRRKALIAVGLIGALALGALYYCQAPRVYEAKAQVLVVKKKPDNVPGLDPTRGSPEEYLATQAAIIKSPVIVARAGQEHGLGALQSFQGTPDFTETVIGKLRVTRDPKDLYNSILELTLRASSPEDARVGLAAIIDSYKKFLDETYRNVSDDTVKLIARVRDEVENDLDRREAEFRDFRLKVPVNLLRGRDGHSLNGDQLLLIHSKRLDLQVRRQEIEARLKAFDEAWKAGRSQDELIAMLTRLGGQPSRSALPEGVEERLLPALLDEKLMLEDYGPHHQNVQRAHRKVELARTLVLEAMKHEVEDLKRSERLLEETFAGYLEEAKKGVAFDVEDETFRSDITRMQQLHDVAIKRLQDADIIKDLGGFDAQVVGPPSARQVKPAALIVFPVAALLGLMAGFGLAFAAEMADKTFRSPEEISRRLSLAVVGHIPHIRPKQEALAAIAAGGSALDPILIAHHRPRSREAESYRGIRTSIYFSARGGRHKVLQVTSPGSGDGKTTLAANLAISVAQSGKRTLLVDAELRRPRLHALFGLPNRRGLSSVIAGECPLAEAVQASGVPGLFVLPAGEVPANPAELLTSPRFQEVVESLREQYDFVLIDTPPLLAVTDPAVVAPRVDGVLLALRVVKNGRPQAERAKEILASLDTPVLGVVVNGGGFRGPDYGGYGYDGYYLGYRGTAGAKVGWNDGGYYEDGEPEGGRARPPAQPRAPGRNGNEQPQGK